MGVNAAVAVPTRQVARIALAVRISVAPLLLMLPVPLVQSHHLSQGRCRH